MDSTSTLSTTPLGSTTTGISTTTIWFPTFSPPFAPHTGAAPWRLSYDPVQKYGFIILAALLTTVFFLIAWITRYILVFYCECGPDPLKYWDKTYRKHMKPPPIPAVSDISKENLAYVESAPHSMSEHGSYPSHMDPSGEKLDLEMQKVPQERSGIPLSGGRDTPTGRGTPTGRKSPNRESPRYRQSRPSTRGMDPLDYDSDAMFSEEPHVHIESEDPNKPGRLTDIKVVDQFGRPASPMRVLQQRASVASGASGIDGLDDEGAVGGAPKPQYNIQRPAPMAPIPSSPPAATGQNLDFRPGDTNA
ncbi:unnamed protein product [Owenia fusiformis]|uniref:Uncharacterized protein n=1 Tax=Owenia fusiformis TaxID=6347 RepID=A0A8J1XWX8_OWEFU|nr:unnamed protein product [Owenia fusiformis]